MAAQQFVSDDQYFYTAVVNLIKEQTYNGTAPWLNESDPSKRDIAHNPASGMVFGGLSGVYMDSIASQRDFKDPRWLTVNEVSNAVASGEIQIKYGEKPLVIAYHNKYQQGNDRDPISGNPVSNLSAPSYYYVYNADQLKGLSPIEMSKDTEMHLKKREHVENNTGKNYKEVLDMISPKSFETKYKGMENTMAAIAAYRYATEMHLPYSPKIDKNICIQELRGKTQDEILKCVYFSEVSRTRLTNPGMRLENPSKQRPAEIDPQRRSYDPNTR